MPIDFRAGESPFLFKYDEVEIPGWCQKSTTVCGLPPQPAIVHQPDLIRMNVVNPATPDLSTLTHGSEREGFRKRGVASIDARVGARFRLMREERRASRRDMAGALGISVQQLSKYEAGTNRMSVGFIYEAAAFLGVPVAALLVEPEGAQAPVIPAAEDAVEEEAVVRFVVRNIRSVAARKDMMGLLAKLGRAAPGGANDARD
jgi:transcriptional regulator with XRE-family HTH domain